MVVVNGSLILLVIFLIQVVTWENGSGLPRRHVQVLFHKAIRIQGIQRRGDGTNCAPLPPWEWGVRLASLAIFFLGMGLGEVCAGDARNLPSEGTSAGAFAKVTEVELVINEAVLLIDLLSTKEAWRKRSSTNFSVTGPSFYVMGTLSSAFS